MKQHHAYQKGFIPYALAAFLIGIVGGFSSVLGPAFVQDLGLSYNNTTWTSLAQAMSTAACAPILGKVGDLVGRKKTLLTGLLVFTLGNALSVLANALILMLAARFIVGIGTAAMAPVILGYIVSEFPPDRTAKGFSMYMLISSGAVIFGPTLGGLIITASGWRTMLWICSAICIAATAVCFAMLRKEKSTGRPLQDFDITGAVLVLVFFSLLLCVPSFGQNFGWGSAPFIFVLIGSFVSLAGLIAAERRAVNPILPGGFMKRRTFGLSIAALFLTQGLLQANMTNTIVFINYTQPENSLISGYAISVMYLGMSLGAVFLGPLADRWEAKLVLTGSLILTGIGCGLLFAFSESTSSLRFMATLGILGFGLGGNGTILMKVALSGLSTQEAGAGTGTYGLFRDLAAPFGASIFVPLFTNNITRQIASGAAGPAAAVQSIYKLAAVELLCVAAGIAAVLILPKTHSAAETSSDRPPDCPSCN